MKLCGTCKNEYPLEEFHNRKRTRDGKDTQCKHCRNKRTKRHYQENRQYYLNKARYNKETHKQWFRELKISLSCKICGENRWPCLQFHHRDTDSKYLAISTMIARGYTKEKVLIEAQKCDVICANCHFCLHAGF